MNANENTVKKVELDAEARPLHERLADVLEAIDRDAATGTERYLRETEVPAGGE